MTAAERIASLDTSDPRDLCARADAALAALLVVMNEETTLLRAGHLQQASECSSRKAELAQAYVTLARSVQREAARIKQVAPDALERLKKHHESLATQMAENLKVLATARSVAQDLLSDVARAVGAAETPKTYGANGALPAGAKAPARGLAVNRAL